MFVLDSHCDTPSALLEGRDLSVDSPTSHVDLPKLERAAVDAVFFALYVPAEMSQNQGLEHVSSMMDALKSALDRTSGRAVLTTDPDEAYNNSSKGLISVFLGLENGSPIGSSLNLLDSFYQSGVRYMTLCHSKDNLICDSCASTTPRWNGLSLFGREVIRRMNTLGMIVDVSHISDSAFYDVLDCSLAPVVATHSCCRALADHPRNLTDDMLRALALNGGVVQINFYPLFLDDSSSAEGAVISYKRIVDHIDHAVSVAGIDHVGIGSDFDGIEITPEGMDNISMLPKIFDEMRRRGYSEADICKIAGENFMRVFREVISLSSASGKQLLLQQQV